MLRGNGEESVMPACADPTLKLFYSELTEADIEFARRGSRIVLSCRDASCPNYPCAYCEVKENT